MEAHLGLGFLTKFLQVLLDLLGDLGLIFLIDVNHDTRIHIDISRNRLNRMQDDNLCIMFSCHIGCVKESVGRVLTESVA